MPPGPCSTHAAGTAASEADDRSRSAVPATHSHDAPSGSLRSPAPRLRRGAAVTARSVALAAISVVSITVLGFVLLAASMAVPDDRVVNQLVIAAERGDFGPDYPRDGFGGISNQFSECKGLTLGVDDPSAQRNAWDRAIAAPILGSCEPATASVRAIRAGAPPVEVFDYFNYWHGYGVVTRPAVAFTGVGGARLVAGGLLMAGFVFTGVVMWRHAGPMASIALLAPVLVATDTIGMPQEPTQAVPIAVALGMAGFTFLAGLRGDRPLLIVSTLAGGMVAFTDRITVSGASLALTAFMAALPSATRGGGPARILRQSAVAAAAWVLGFIGVWSAKWLIAMPVMGASATVARVSERTQFRISGDWPSVDPTPGAAVRVNVSYWLTTMGTARLVLVSGLVVLVSLVITAVARRQFGRLVTAATLAAPSVIVVLWFEALRNHSQIHAFFTYRNAAVAFGIVLAAAVVALHGTRARDRLAA